MTYKKEIPGPRRRAEKLATLINDFKVKVVWGKMTTDKTEKLDPNRPRVFRSYVFFPRSRWNGACSRQNRSDSCMLASTY